MMPTGSPETDHAKSVELRILVDADACPVREEVYKVAFRYDIPVSVVANSFMRVPVSPLVEFVLVEAGPDVADDEIAARADARSVVVTADIPLADRCLKAGAVVIAPNGKPFTDNSIGAALAIRAIKEDLRAGGEITGGPPPFQRRDRSQFLQALDQALVRLQRAR